MKRLLVAGTVLFFLGANLRAEERDAYGSLVAMGASAKTDKGPSAEELELPKNGGRDRNPEQKGAAPDDENELDPEAAPRPAPIVSTAVAPAPSAKKEDDARLPVKVPEAAAPRVWTRVFASLIPAPRSSGIPSFDVAVSTHAPRPRMIAIRTVTPASQAGAAQGLLEVVSAATAPSDAR